MSSEECSLAFDEEESQCFEPELSVRVNLRYENQENSSADKTDEVIRVGGRMTISF